MLLIPTLPFPRRASEMQERAPTIQARYPRCLRVIISNAANGSLAATGHRGRSCKHHCRRQSSRLCLSSRVLSYCSWLWQPRAALDLVGWITRGAALLRPASFRQPSVAQVLVHLGLKGQGTENLYCAGQHGLERLRMLRKHVVKSEWFNWRIRRAEILHAMPS